MKPLPSSYYGILSIITMVLIASISMLPAIGAENNLIANDGETGRSVKESYNFFSNSSQGGFFKLEGFINMACGLEVEWTV